MINIMAYGELSHQIRNSIHRRQRCRYYSTKGEKKRRNERDNVELLNNKNGSTSIDDDDCALDFLYAHIRYR